jgi:CRP/FNR family transcriptional regulator, cyclic AMP receptor protein
MKKSNVPSSLTDYNSLWNPVLEAFSKNVSDDGDQSHFSQGNAPIGLYHKNKRLMIDLVVLQSYGAKEVHLQKDEMLFREGEEAQNYFQVQHGSIKMITNSPDGQEFIQGVFKTNDSFGEPPLFCSFPYPSNAIALEPTLIMKLSKEKFFTLLRENFEIHIHLDQVLCQRLRYKSMVLSEISFYDPEHRITSLLKYLKEESGNQYKRYPEMVGDAATYVVPFTRQQLADMSGLRVETVIRTVKKMQEEGKLKLIGRKITL